MAYLYLQTINRAGVTDDFIVSHYFKKLTQLEMTFGDSLHHLGEVSGRMQATSGVFS